MDQVVIRFRKEIVKEILNKIEHQDDRAGNDVCSRLAEYGALAEERAELVVREPNEKNGNDRAGYAHFYYVRPVFAFLAAGVVYDICPNSGKRNVYDNGNEVHDVHIDRLNAECVSDQYVRCG